MTTVQPAARAAPALRVIMAEGTTSAISWARLTVPRGDNTNDTDRLTDGDITHTIHGGWNGIAIHPHRFMRKPFDE